jgi:hypothetical protein
MAGGDDAAAQVAGLFAGGMSIAQLADEWGEDAAWVEAAIRVALLGYIPKREGGTKISRTEARAERKEDVRALRAAQGVLEWE